MNAHVEDAINRGAKLIAGHQSNQKWPTKMYVEPVILDHVTKDAILNKDEMFGPIIP